MSQEDTVRSDLPAIRAVIDAIIKAVRAGDVDAFLALCAPDIVVFDLLPPLEHKGMDAIRRNWTAALGSFERPIEYDVDHLELAIGADVAWSRSLTRFGGVTKDGKHVTQLLRSTLGFRKIAGRWKIMHQHVSVPFDMQSGQALLDEKE